MNAGKLTIVLAYALLGCTLCAATMGLSLAILPLADALFIHVFAAPLFYIVISRSYFQKFAYTTPLQTAFVFLGVVVLVNFFLVTRGIYHSLNMFASLLGTWIPFILIFAATHLTGLVMSLRPQSRLATR